MSADLDDVRERLNDRIQELERENTRLQLRLRGADRLADEVAILVQRKVIGSRCPAADALLDFRDPPQSERSNELESLRRALADAHRAGRSSKIVN
jgi:hypothetical protein